MIFSTTTQRAIRNKGMAAVYGIAAEFDCEPSDVLDLLVTTSFTETSIPVSSASQPNPPPSAAQTDGTGPSSSRPTAPSVEPDTSTVPPVDGQARHDSDQGHALTDPEAVIQPSLPGAEGAPDRAPIAKGQRVKRCHSEHPDWPASLIADELGIKPSSVRAFASLEGLRLPTQREYEAAQAAKTAEALRTAIQPETPPPAIPEHAIEAKPPTLAQRIRDHLAEHPDATLREVTDAIGGNMKAVGWAAQKAGITLRKRNAQERSEASARGAQGRARPSEPIAAPDETAIQPDETVMPEPQALRQYRPAPPTTARFYLRDREGRFVHQSLQACPTGPGPLMTSDRKWAWCDNSQRFKGARKLWPEIATMRKEASNA